MANRLFISLLTAGALLAQALAPAWATTGMAGVGAAPAQEQVQPCHDMDMDMDMAPSDTGTAQHDCCGTDSCMCAAACAGSALPAVSVPPVTAPGTSLESPRLTLAALPAHRFTPLRPPIASQH